MNMRPTIQMTALILLLTTSGIVLPAPPPKVGVASVIDGDTLEIHGQRIRLFGVDAPESGQRCLNGGGQLYRCGKDSAFALSGLIGESTVKCEARDSGKDRYGRMVAECFLGPASLNEWLVRYGHAVAYRRYAKDFVSAEDLARTARRGVWAGAFINPAEWRKGGRLPEELQ